MNEISFRNKLRVARAEKRVSQGELAEMVGVSRQTISSIENNQFCPSAKLALLLCIALDKKFEAFGFEVIKIDGHDFEQIKSALDKAKTVKGKPTAILAKTVKGKGVSFMENEYKWHYGGLVEELYLKAKAEVEAM